MDQLADFLRTFVNSQEKTKGLWDFDGVVHVLGSLLDNIRNHAIGEDVKAVPRLLTPMQKTVLLHIARAVEKS